jgi:hypothetical protein
VSSNINYLSINENFPVAGQDNDTQVFRDNFDTIKNSLREAKDEISDLQADSAKINVDNDFNLKVIQNAVLQNVRTQKFDAGNLETTPVFTVDYQNGSYQIVRFGTNVNFDFLNFPGGPELTAEVTPVGLGKVTLELYSDGAERTASFITSGSTVIKKNGAWPTGNDTLAIDSAVDPIIVEVWRHSASVIFMNYLGKFS